MEEIDYPIADMDDWDSFVRANRDSLLGQYPTIADAMKAACDGGIVLGGGAAPLVNVYFVD